MNHHYTCDVREEMAREVIFSLFAILQPGTIDPYEDRQFNNLCQNFIKLAHFRKNRKALCFVNFKRSQNFNLNTKNYPNRFGTKNH